ncbi:MAG: MFS transporter [Thermoplasmata archaeon]
MDKNILIIIAGRVPLSFSYGFLNVLLSLYLLSIGYNYLAIGIIIGVAIIISALLSFFIAMLADHYGRKFVLIILFILFFLSSILFLQTKNIYSLALLSGIGGFTGSGGGPIGSGGPFGAIQTAMITEFTDRKSFSSVLSIASALGMLASVVGAFFIEVFELLSINVYLLFYVASIFGLVGAIITFAVKDNKMRSKHLLPHLSWKNIIKLTIPTMPGGIGSGLITPIFSMWFHIKFNLTSGQIGLIFGAANLFTIFMMLLLPKITSKESELKTIISTRVIGSFALILIAITPFLWLSIILFMLRNGFQMGAVPIRQSFAMGIVDDTERATTSGATSMARTGFSSISPPLSGSIIASSLAYPPLFGGVISLFDPIFYYILFKRYWK